MNNEDQANKQHAAGTAEDTSTTAGAAGQDPSHEQLLITLQDAQAKADQHWNQLLLARAETENVRRRAERDVESAHKYALEKFVRELLPVRDSLELGLAATEGEQSDLGKIREGMELTLKVFGNALEKFGVKAVEPKGDRFNPELHQAMAMQETSDVEPNTVLTVYQKGYTLNDRLLRPAMVVVSRAVEERNSP